MLLDTLSRQPTPLFGRQRRRGRSARTWSTTSRALLFSWTSNLLRKVWGLKRRINSNRSVNRQVMVLNTQRRIPWRPFRKIPLTVRFINMIYNNKMIEHTDSFFLIYAKLLCFINCNASYIINDTIVYLIIVYIVLFIVYRSQSFSTLPEQLYWLLYIKFIPYIKPLILIKSSYFIYCNYGFIH